VPPKAETETRPEALFDQPIAPNPFPPRDEPKRSELLPLEGPEMGLKPSSPSDAEPVFPDRAKEGTLNSDASDPTQPWPRSVRKPSVNCDDVRLRVAAADIGSIDLDVAPSFGTGYNDRASNEERQKSLSSPVRSVNGMIVREARSPKDVWSISHIIAWWSNPKPAADNRWISAR
jgi:hypothetical protein